MFFQDLAKIGSRAEPQRIADPFHTLICGLQKLYGLFDSHFLAQIIGRTPVAPGENIVKARLTHIAVGSYRFHGCFWILVQIPLYLLKNIALNAAVTHLWQRKTQQTEEVT